MFINVLKYISLIIVHPSNHLHTYHISKKINTAYSLKVLVHVYTGIIAINV